MPFITLTNQNIRMYYQQYGDPQFPPLILISGLKADHKIWGSLLESLAKTHHLLTFDNRGSGQTSDDENPFSLETMADDVIELMHALNIKHPFITGHSLGGAITQIIARKYTTKIRKIILCNTFMKLNANAKQGFTHILDLHRQGATAAEIMHGIVPWGFSASFATAEFLQTLYQTSNDEPHPQTLNGYQRQLDAILEFDSSQWVNTIKVPTLVIGSENDITATKEEAKALNQQIRCSTSLILPGAHASMVEQPKLLSQAIKHYCRDIHNDAMTGSLHRTIV